MTLNKLGHDFPGTLTLPAAVRGSPGVEAGEGVLPSTKST